ncbi:MULTISPECIES: nucleotidyltransferase [unclassified Bacillus (in: firmicutes)]|uniref:nucleotidyltransferase n=1 Tax=unclassified Bacillus (in: firmicutes) TaxID=185979 RepID=UPI0008F420A1|nr:MULTISPECIES: nucleotidyltransferase [unclassified Bacillus (in: firmicutes)]SFA75742.1 Predicted nucleotidyltransferase [Bacillus sp. UNCCL13]SFQ65810.1 Predicted nucleotidyltransferase [Bacillus sp. cl95]
MHAVGVIVEYNPFHNGHAYHVSSAKEVSGADIVIAVMSGNFLQRGEPAMVSKWMRAKMALLGGVDLVFELPYKFATQHAEIFADGSVSLLSEVGCQSFCFGSEDGDISSFYNTISFLQEHSAAYNDEIKHKMNLGMSYPRAASEAFISLNAGPQLLDLSKPNNILGFQYVKSALQQKSSMKPITIKRKNADYHDEHFASATIASATSIRKAVFLKDSNYDQIAQYVPSTTYEQLNDYFNQYGVLHSWEMYWPLLKYRLLHSSAKELKEIYEIEEGLENRFIEACMHAETFQQFMELVKTKRYTWTRLQRACVHILTNTKKDDMLQNEKASYLRLLGMTTNGREYLNKMKKHFSLPLVSKLSSYQHPQLDLDIKASRIYALGIPVQKQNEYLKMEYKQSPIYIQNSESVGS